MYWLKLNLFYCLKGKMDGFKQTANHTQPASEGCIDFANTEGIISHQSFNDTKHTTESALLFFPGLTVHSRIKQSVTLLCAFV